MLASNRAHRRIAELLVAVAAGCLLGLVSGVLSPWLVLAVVVGGAVASFVMARPELAILLMLVGYCTIFDTDIVPYLSAGGLSVNVLDLALIGSLAWVAVRRLLDPDYGIRVTSVGAAIMIFILVAVSSTVVGLLKGTTLIDSAASEMRYFAYYLTYFMVVYLVGDLKRLRLLLYGALLLSVATALAMIAQFVVGSSVPILAGRIEQFAQDGSLVSDVARVLPPGRYLVLAGFIALTVSLSLGKLSWRRALAVSGWLALGLAVLLTFNRNFWLSTAVAITVFAIAATRTERRRIASLLGTTALAGILVIAGGALLFPQSRAADLALSLAERFGSLTEASTYTASNNKDLSTSSLEFRKIETEYAFKKLWPPNLLGLGVGAHYRPTLPSLDWEEFDGRGYIHDGHLWILLKTGILGFIALIGAMVLTIVHGLRTWRSAPSDLQAAVLGAALVVLAVLLSSLVDPIITQLNWTPLFGVLAGAVDVVANRSARQSTSTSIRQGPSARATPAPHYMGPAE